MGENKGRMFVVQENLEKLNSAAEEVNRLEKELSVGFACVPV